MFRLRVLSLLSVNRLISPAVSYSSFPLHNPYYYSCNKICHLNPQITFKNYHCPFLNLKSSRSGFSTAQYINSGNYKAKIKSWESAKSFLKNSQNYFFNKSRSKWLVYSFSVSFLMVMNLKR